jgi:hypothetical protein
VAVTAIQTIGDAPSREAEWRDDQNRSYRQTLRVITDSAADDQYTVVAAVSAVYPLYSAHASDSLALLKTIRPRATEHPRRWEVELEWNTDTEQEIELSPLNRPPTTRYSTEVVSRAVDEDLAGNAVRNSAGEPFEPPAELEVPRLVIQVQHNKESVDAPDIVANYLRRTNSVSWRGFAAGTVLLREFTADEEFEGGVYFFNTNWTFVVEPEGWLLRLLDHGRNYLSAGALVPVVDANGSPRADGGLLDGAGGLLAVGGTPVFREFTVFGEADFNDLALP